VARLAEDVVAEGWAGADARVDVTDRVGAGGAARAEASQQVGDLAAAREEVDRRVADAEARDAAVQRRGRLTRRGEVHGQVVVERAVRQAEVDVAIDTVERVDGAGPEQERAHDLTVGRDLRR